MKIRANNNAVMQVFLDYYYPLWKKAGFSWKLFPDLTVYININPSGGQGFTNSHREHYSPDEPYVFAKIQSREEIGALGADFDVFIKALPSSLFHEIGHHIHYKYGTTGDSPFWETAQRLSEGKIGRDFREQTQGGYWKIQAHEDFANYFDSIIAGKINNEMFLDWVAVLIGVERVKVIELTIDSKMVLVNGVKTEIDVEPIIHKKRAMVPLRFVAEELGFNVKWDDEERTIKIIKPTE